MENRTIPQYPVFIFPFSLEFVHEDPSAHKRLLAIYNPYDFKLKFRILSTASEKYTVVEPKGTLASKSKIDIIIRHLKANKKNYIGIVDKLRVEISNATTDEYLGHRDLKLSLVEKAFPSKNDEGAASYSEIESSAADLRRRGVALRRSRTGSVAREDVVLNVPHEQPMNIPHWVLIILIFFCFLTLILPVENGYQNTGETFDLKTESSTVKEVVVQFFKRCTTTNTQKLVAAYILGIISCLIIKMQ